MYTWGYGINQNWWPIHKLFQISAICIWPMKLAVIECYVFIIVLNCNYINWIIVNVIVYTVFSNFLYLSS